MTITIPPFTTSEHPFFREDDVTVKVVCESDMYGFELQEDDCMKRVYISDFKKDGKGTKGCQSCNMICSTERATRRKYHGAHITATDDEEICDAGPGEREVGRTLEQEGGFLHNASGSGTKTE